MTIFHVLPHLDVAGGVKVAIQHSHLLNELGHSCWVTAPDVSQNPFPGYGGARFLPWDRARGEVGRDDVVVFNWSEDIARFGGTASAHRYYFAQATPTASATSSPPTSGSSASAVRCSAFSSIATAGTDGGSPTGSMSGPSIPLRRSGAPAGWG